MRCMDMFGIDKNTLKGGFMTTIAIEVIRGIINSSLKNTTPRQLVEAIRDDTSLWGNAGGEISGYAKQLPISNFSIIKDVREIVDAQYGGFDVVVLKWLSEDHVLLYNVIVNSPNNTGRIWLKKQTTEILDGVEHGNK